MLLPHWVHGSNKSFTCWNSSGTQFMDQLYQLDVVWFWFIKSKGFSGNWERGWEVSVDWIIYSVQIFVKASHFISNFDSEYINQFFLVSAVNLLYFSLMIIIGIIFIIWVTINGLLSLWGSSGSGTSNPYDFYIDFLISCESFWFFFSFSVKIWQCYCEELLASSDSNFASFSLLKEVLFNSLNDLLFQYVILLQHSLKLVISLQVISGEGVPTVLSLNMPKLSEHKLFLAIGRGSGSLEIRIFNLSSSEFDNILLSDAHCHVVSILWTEEYSW